MDDATSDGARRVLASSVVVDAAAGEIKKDAYRRGSTPRRKLEGTKHFEEGLPM